MGRSSYRNSTERNRLFRSFVLGEVYTNAPTTSRYTENDVPVVRAHSTEHALYSYDTCIAVHTDTGILINTTRYTNSTAKLVKALQHYLSYHEIPFFAYEGMSLPRGIGPMQLLNDVSHKRHFMVFGAEMEYPIRFVGNIVVALIDVIDSKRGENIEPHRTIVNKENDDASFMGADSVRYQFDHEGTCWKFVESTDAAYNRGNKYPWVMDSWTLHDSGCDLRK